MKSRHSTVVGNSFDVALEVLFDEVSLFFGEAFPRSLFTPRCFSFCSVFI